MKILFSTEPKIKKDPELSILQKDIIQFIRDGLTSKEISLVTNISHDELNRQRKTILNTTGCQTMFDVISLLGKNRLAVKGI